LSEKSIDFESQTEKGIESKILCVLLSFMRKERGKMLKNCKKPLDMEFAPAIIMSLTTTRGYYCDD
jgi:hypothetical protein